MNNLLNYNNYITEGLVHTYPISVYYNTLYDNLLFLINKNIIFNIIPNNLNETFKIELSKIDFDDIVLIDSFCSNLGYFLTKFKITIGDSSNTLKYNYKTFYNDIKNNNGLTVFYESKFDTIIKIEKNQKLYHATTINHLERILKIGLYPKAESKIEHHYERIYFYDNINDCIKNIPKLRGFSSSLVKDYIILEINNSDYKYYKDSKSSGIYTYQNIKKDDIEILKNIYTANNIIDFDNFKINNISNPTYLEFFKNDKIVYDLNRNNIK